MKRLPDGLKTCIEDLADSIFSLADAVKALASDQEPLPDPTPTTPSEPPTTPSEPPTTTFDDLPNVLQTPRLWIWREASAANDFGVKEAVVCAVRGTAGAATVRIICMNGDPVVDVQSMVKRTKRAADEGCKAVCIDLESYFIRQGRSHAEEVYRQVSPILPLLWAPKAFNDHLIKHWKIKDFAQAAQWLGTYGDGQIAWAYSREDAASWLDLYRLSRKSGNTDLYVPLGDFAVRSDHSPFLPIVPMQFKENGLSIGTFMPDSGSWTNIVCDTQVWKNSVRVYG